MPFRFKKIMMALLVIAFAKAATAQLDRPTAPTKAQLRTAELMASAQSHARSNNLAAAEADYRRAVAMDSTLATAHYNMGVLYDRDSMAVHAGNKYRYSAKQAKTKEEKHRAYHNLGNKWLEKKQYGKAVESYKQALRNDPTDDETRYNLAIAQQEKEKNGGGSDNQQEDQNQDKDQENQEDKQEEKKKDQEGNSQKNKPQDKEGDQKDEGGDQEGQKKEGNDDKKEEQSGKGDQNKDPEQSEGQQSRPQRNRMGKQQMQQLLKAMSEEEQKIQEKIKARQQKGQPVQTEKDW